MVGVLLGAVLGGVSIPLAGGRDTLRDPLAQPGGSRREASRTPKSAAAPPEKRIRFVEAWRVPLRSPLSGPLTLLGDRVVASVEGGAVQAFSLHEGSPRWKTDLEEKLAGGPVEVDGLIVQAAASGRLVGLEGENGDRLWSLDLQGEIRRQITSVSDGVLVPLASGQVVSVDAQGRERWRVDLRGEPSKLSLR